MPYVSRKDGAVNGVFNSPQPGLAEEWADEDSEEVVALRERAKKLTEHPASVESRPVPSDQQTRHPT